MSCGFCWLANADFARFSPRQTERCLLGVSVRTSIIEQNAAVLVVNGCIDAFSMLVCLKWPLFELTCRLLAWKRTSLAAGRAGRLARTEHCQCCNPLFRAIRCLQEVSPSRQNECRDSNRLTCRPLSLAVYICTSEFQQCDRAALYVVVAIWPARGQ